MAAARRRTCCAAPTRVLLRHVTQQRDAQAALHLQALAQPAAACTRGLGSDQCVGTGRVLLASPGAAHACRACTALRHASPPEQVLQLREALGLQADVAQPLKGGGGRGRVLQPHSARHGGSIRKRDAQRDIGAAATQGKRGKKVLRKGRERQPGSRGHAAGRARCRQTTGTRKQRLHAALTWSDPTAAGWPPTRAAACGGRATSSRHPTAAQRLHAAR